MANRPRQLSVVIDYMLKASPMQAEIDPARVGAFGFSSGGFTVLVAAGGEPDLRTVPAHCKAHPDFFDCKLTASHPPPADVLKSVWTHDARIKAVVSAAPAMGYSFTKAGLARVSVPLQLWRAGDDQILPDPFYASTVRANLPKAPEWHVVPGAGHFDFLTPCNDKGRATAAFICTSAPGFDRAAFHEDFDTKVVGFFKANLMRP
jgi:predicted dienelactone hydrolase